MDEANLNHTNEQHDVDYSSAEVAQGPQQPEVDYTELLTASEAAGPLVLAETVERPMPAGSTSLRPGYWSRPTEAQIDNAAKYGFDLSKQRKYYS